MKLPEKPIDWSKVLKEEGEQLFKRVGSKNLFHTVMEFNKRYLYWDQLNYRLKDPLDRKYVWTMMKFIRSEKSASVSFPRLGLTYVAVPEINRQLHIFDKFLAGNIEIQSKNLGLEKRYIVSSLMEEAIASSILEGAATTREAAKAMLRQKRRPKNVNEQMVVNGFETMQMILKRQNEKLTPEFLLEIQAMITKETLKNPEDVGKFRDNDRIVVGDVIHPEVIYHVPPKSKEVKQLVQQLCDFANDDGGEFIHPIIKGTILHFLIGYIHPFNDGNGRTARSVFYWYVLSRGYWLFEYMAVSRRILRSKKDYGMAYLYTEYDEMDLTYFLKYVLVCIEDSLNDLRSYLKRKQKEHSEAQVVIEKLKHLSYRQTIILQEFMNNPDRSYTIQEIARSYNTVYQTARTDLLFLAKLGYLIMNRVSRKFIFYFNKNSREIMAADSRG